VHFPKGNYSWFYPGMSNINQFPVLLNSEFEQNLPLQKDSFIYLKDY
jgi:hypothetical protein